MRIEKDNSNNKRIREIDFFKFVLLILLVLIIAPLILILVYPVIILFILILIPIVLVSIVLKGKTGTSIGFQINLDLNNASLIDTHKNKEIKEGIDSLLKYAKDKTCDKEKD